MPVFKNNKMIFDPRALMEDCPDCPENEALSQEELLQPNTALPQADLLPGNLDAEYSGDDPAALSSAGADEFTDEYSAPEPEMIEPEMAYPEPPLPTPPGAGMMPPPTPPSPAGLSAPPPAPGAPAPGLGAGTGQGAPGPGMIDLDTLPEEFKQLLMGGGR